MSEKDEALKLALEALTANSDRVTEISKQRKAITAIREALVEQPALEHEPENEPWCSMHSKPATPEMNVAVDVALGIVRKQPAQRQNSIEPIEFLSGFLTERLAIERGIEWTPAIHDLCNRAIEEEKLAEQPAQQEPVAWMDGYSNIYSLEEKAAGCEDAVIPLVPATLQHWSDCAVHNEPAYQSGKCDCGGYTSPQPAQQKIGVCGEKRGACGLPCEPCEGKTDPDYVQQPAQQPLTDTELINQGCRYQTELTQPVQQQEPEVGVGAENGAKPSETRMDTGFSGGGNPPAQQQVPRAARGDWGAKRKQPAQQDQGQSCYCPECERLSKELAALKAQQQPKFSARDDAERLKSVGRGMSYNDASEAVWKHTLMEIAMRLETGGYTSPPPRKPWVGLTTADRKQLLHDHHPDIDPVSFFDAVEAKLKEKNA